MKDETPFFEDKYSVFQVSSKHGFSKQCGYFVFPLRWIFADIVVQYASFLKVLRIEIIYRGIFKTKKFTIELDKDKIL